MLKNIGKQLLYEYQLCHLCYKAKKLKQWVVHKMC